LAIVAPASAEKLRGGYYTPAPLARFLAGWVGAAGPRLLEPSCGDGLVLREFDRGAAAVGIEIEPDEAERAAAANPGATVVEGDFFKWFAAEGRPGTWDGVAGNPPFIRFGAWSDPVRSRALRQMREAGLRPSRFTNAWVPFVVAATQALREGGRLGLVVPAELLQVGYAAELRAFLVDRFRELTAVTFTRLVFDGVSQEVILLLGEAGPGPAAIRVVQVEDADSLPEVDELAGLPQAPALEHDSEKWTKYFLPPDSIRLLRAVRPTLPRLGDLADVDVGLVTGRNQFFVMRPSEGEARSLGRYLAPLVSKSAQLRGTRLDGDDLERLRHADEHCAVLALSADAVAAERASDAGDPLLAYLASGEADRVHEGYKCSIRRQWWVVPLQWTPDAFLLRQIYDGPRLVANLAGATSTDTIHRLRMRGGTAPEKLAAAAVNSVTFAFSEILGRSYGGGVLELEPREAEDLPIPDPTALTDADVAEVDQLLRDRQMSAALDLVDSKLLGDLGGAERAELRAVWETLRDRRRGRSRRGRYSSGRSGGAVR
jgi:adenine-specific DNA methylase